MSCLRLYTSHFKSADLNLFMGYWSLHIYDWIPNYRLKSRLHQAAKKVINTFSYLYIYTFKAICQNHLCASFDIVILCLLQHSSIRCRFIWHSHIIFHSFFCTFLNLKFINNNNKNKREQRMTFVIIIGSLYAHANCD